MSKPAWIVVIAILAACGTVDYLDRNLKQPQVPAMFYGMVMSFLVWGIDSVVRRLHRRRSARAEEQVER